MLRKLTVLICIISFCPVAAGAQDLALLANAQQPLVSQRGESDLSAPAAIPLRPQRDALPGELNFSPPLHKEATIVLAANDTQRCAEVTESKKTHPGLSLGEFAEVHFGGYRWIYWVGAITGLVLLHVFAFSHD